MEDTYGKGSIFCMLMESVIGVKSKFSTYVVGQK